MQSSPESDNPAGFLLRLREKPELFVLLISGVVAIVVAGLFQVGDALTSNAGRYQDIQQSLASLQTQIDDLKNTQMELGNSVSDLSDDVSVLKAAQSSATPAQKLEQVTVKLGEVNSRLDALESRVAILSGQETTGTASPPINAKAFVSKVLTTVGSTGSRLAEWELKRAQGDKYARDFTPAEKKLIDDLTAHFVDYDTDRNARLEANEIQKVISRKQG